MKKELSLLKDRALLISSAIEACKKLNPLSQWRNPVMFTVWIASAYVTVAIFSDAGKSGNQQFFDLCVAFWLWLTVWFGNWAEALAEGRGKAQAAALRALRSESSAKKLVDEVNRKYEIVNASTLRPGDLIMIEPNDIIPCDGEVVDGVASVDESAITGESAPVIRGGGGDFTSVTGGTRLLTDFLVIRCSNQPGDSWLDKMIALVEGAKRRKTPTELALSSLLAMLTLVFVLVVLTLLPISTSPLISAKGIGVDPVVLMALFVCLIPTTIGGLLSAIGVAGMSRMLGINVLATSGRAVEAAGDVDVLLLDKTGTITYGNRQAVAFWPAKGVSERELAEAALLSSLGDRTPEGESIIHLAARFDLEATTEVGDEIVEFTAQTRMSGLDRQGQIWRKGAVNSIKNWVLRQDGPFPPEVEAASNRVSGQGGTPLAVSVGNRVLGVIELKDIVKPGIRERFADLRKMGIRTVMVTGDNPLTAAAIAAEAGVDDYKAEATPEMKLEFIRSEQAKGLVVAMTGDGTNDAPALAQADVAVAMNSGTQAAREAANMVDLDSSPTKLLDVVIVGKQILMTRGALTTFSIANDVAKYFAILPAAFLVISPVFGKLNILGLSSPQSAILAAVIFNAVVIPLLTPLALKGVKLRSLDISTLLRRNVLIYGVGGLLCPFAGIWLIDRFLALFGLFN